MTPAPTENTSELLALAHDGDISAVSQIMEEEPRLVGQSLAFCGDRHLAQDLVQETMLAAWKSLHRFHGYCRLFAYLCGIWLRDAARVEELSFDTTLHYSTMRRIRSVSASPRPRWKRAFACALVLVFGAITMLWQVGPTR